MTVISKKVNVYSNLHTNVLEDDRDTHELLKRVFDLNGLPNIEFFTDSDLFVEALSENVHLCILDQIIKGSVLQGIDVSRIIRTRFPKCQIIFLTGHDDPALLKQLIKIRPEGYVDKNDDDYMSKLVEEVQKCLSEIKKNLELAIRLENYKQNEQ